MTDQAILIDADAILQLKQWGYWEKVMKGLGKNAWVAEVVACKEIKYYKDRVTGVRRRFTLDHLSDESVPRMIRPGKLSSAEYTQYLRHFAALQGAGPGERESFALAWVLNADVCSRDVAAASIFHANKPMGCASRHYDVMDLLRMLKLIQ